MAQSPNKKIVVIGGGTGSFTVLTGLKKYPFDLTAIVAMADDGGSTGILRDELGVLPPGDVRQCLTALSSEGALARKLMTYRFSEGTLRGHSLGNLLLSSLEKMTGSFEKAIEELSVLLHIKGNVVPATLDETHLVAHTEEGKIIRGQYNVRESDLTNLRSIALEPSANLNPRAKSALLDADVIIIGPGDVYSSIISNLLVRGMSAAISSSKAKKIFICNLVAKAGHTNGLSVLNLTALIERYLESLFDYVLYNTQEPTEELMKKYAREGDFPIALGVITDKKFIGADLLSNISKRRQKGDMIVRSLIRHDPKKLAEAISKLI